MNDDIENLARRDAEVGTIILALILSAKSQPSFDAETFKAKVEHTLSRLEAKGGDNYTGLVRDLMDEALAS